MISTPLFIWFPLYPYMGLLGWFNVLGWATGLVNTVLIIIEPAPTKMFVHLGIEDSVKLGF